jgi:drug/metabolite transporter (DMT)-like permease
MGAVSAICHFLVISAFRYADSSVLAPLAYLELVTATAIGSVIFKQNPNVLACVGIFLIISSGLALWLFKRTKVAVEK